MSDAPQTPDPQPPAAAPDPSTGPEYRQQPVPAPGHLGYPSPPGYAGQTGTPGPPRLVMYPGYAVAAQPPPPARYPVAPPPPVVALHNGQPLPVTARVEALPGTDLGVAYLRIPPTVNGLAVGGLVAGIGSILVSLLVSCVGTVTAAGVAVAGAFAMLGVAAGGGGLWLGIAGWRQAGRLTSGIGGRGLAIAAIACGGAGLLLTAVGVLLSILTTASAAGSGG